MFAINTYEIFAILSIIFIFIPSLLSIIYLIPLIKEEKGRKKKKKKEERRRKRKRKRRRRRKRKRRRRNF
jgi:predicted membrane protein